MFLCSETVACEAELSTMRLFYNKIKIVFSKIISTLFFDSFYVVSKGKQKIKLLIN